MLNRNAAMTFACFEPRECPKNLFPSAFTRIPSKSYFIQPLSAFSGHRISASPLVTNPSPEPECAFDMLIRNAAMIFTRFESC
jgi:hypothetical protein